MHCIGFVVNPVAGMGGTVGLKGTDDQVEEACRRGAVARAPARAIEALTALRDADILFLTCSGPMGEDELVAADWPAYTVVYNGSTPSSGEDTRTASRCFLDAGAEMILFCGGDGTARDVWDAAGNRVPILGIPAGVKMYSGVFAVTPTAGATVLASGTPAYREVEVMDVDEDAYRAGRLDTCLYGYARVPFVTSMVQLHKEVYESADEDRAKREIGEFIAEVMVPGILYLLGAGTTTEAIARRIGIEKTLLGVDAVVDGRLVAADLNEKGLLELLTQYKRVRIIVSPIGAQGFLFGRGNQQISAGVIRSAGIDRITVVATPQKMRATPLLHVDTGDAKLDAEFGRSIQVVTGYRIAERKPIGGPS